MIPGRRHWVWLAILAGLLSAFIWLGHIAVLLAYACTVALLSVLLFSSRLAAVLDALSVSPRRRMFAIWASVFIYSWLRHADLAEPEGYRSARVLALSESTLGVRVRLRTHLPLVEFEKRVLRLSSLAEVFRVDVSQGEPGVIDFDFVLHDPLSRATNYSPASRPTRTPVLIGNTESGQAELDLSDESHIAIQGRTRSGKSMLATVMLDQLRGYPHVAIVGVDPSGLLLGGDSNAVRGTSEPLAMKEHLEQVVGEMDRRIASLAVNGHAKKETFTPSDPLIIVVLEEAPAIVRVAQGQSRQLADAIQLNVSRLAAEGAKAGIRLIVLAQRFDANLLGGDVRQNFATRITLAVPDATSVRMLHDDADDQLERFVVGASPGLGLLTRPGTRTERFRVHTLTERAAESDAL